VTSLFAHRGHHARWPENSVAAMAAARDVGADGVELDVWLTVDKHLVVNHDRTIAGRDVTSSTWLDLTGGPSAPAPASLAPVVEAAGGLRINVEIKSTRSAPYNLSVARSVAEFLDASPSSARCLVSSFSLAVCEEVRRVAPTRPVGWLTHRHRGADVLDQVVRSGLTSAHLPFSKVTPELARRALGLGVELHVWTPNLARDIDRMLELEVGAVITDDVPLARALRDRRGAATDG
jgi:glycerophosphoryl diester phosphodiesterase